jgi:hypothetical protein
MEKHFKPSSKHPLWLAGTKKIPLSGNAFVCVPDFFAEMDASLAESYAQRVLELGYDGCIVGCLNFFPQEQPGSLDSLLLFREALAKLHLSLLVKLEIEEIGSMNECARTMEQLGVDGLFWESKWQHPNYVHGPENQYLTLSEIVVREMQQVEEQFSFCRNLIFYIPASNGNAAAAQADWLLNVTEEAASSTLVAFSSIAGSPWIKHLSAHPFWKKIHAEPNIRAIPIIHIEGNTIPYENYELAHSRLAGLISISEKIPVSGEFLDCILSIEKYLLERDGKPEYFLADWFMQKTGWDYFELRPMLKEMRFVSCEICAWIAHSENYEMEKRRLFQESISYRLRVLQSKCEQLRLESAFQSVFNWQGHCRTFFQQMRQAVMS